MIRTNHGPGDWGFKSLCGRQPSGCPQASAGDRFVTGFLPKTLQRKVQLSCVLTLILCFSGCTTTTSVSRKPGEQRQGFFRKDEGSGDREAVQRGQVCLPLRVGTGRRAL
jgi:hypothetical protein